MANFVLKLRSLSSQDLSRLAAAFDNYKPILKQIGVVLLAQAQKAFRDQEFGTEKWPARYPNQSPFYANVAGVVADFAVEKRLAPLARRFQNRPAGIDTGQTLRSLTFSKAVSVDQTSVKVSSNTEAAFHLQNGGETSQEITKEIKDKLNEWMKKSRNRMKREKRKSQPIRSADSAAEKLGWLFQKTELVTKINPRPFLGITPSSHAKIIRIAGGEFVKSAGGTV